LSKTRLFKLNFIAGSTGLAATTQWAN